MEWYVVLAGMIALLLVIVIGLPIPFALAGACLPFLWRIQSWDTSLVSAQLKLWGVWVDYILLSVPLFVFLGELISKSQIGSRLYHALHHGLPVRVTAAYGTVATCAAFGAVCGSSMVGALTIGGVALPEMLKLGYNKRLACGVVAAGGTLSVLIPPSLILLYYGIVTDVSVGHLFLAGAVPGIILALLFCVAVKVWQILQQAAVPPIDRAARTTPLAIVVALLPIAVIGGIILSTIYFGIATPTEAAAVAVVVTMGLAFAVGGLTVQGSLDALVATMRTMGFVGLLVAAAVLFGFVLNYYLVPQKLSAVFASFQFPSLAVLGAVILFYFVIGMFMEPTSITFITLPTVFPLIHQAGYDLVWFGVIYTITMEIAVLTPPVGLNLYVLQQLAPSYRLTISDAALGSLPFIGMMLILIALVILFPQLALWLPANTK